MAAYRPDITENTDAVLKLAARILSYGERNRLRELLGEFDSGAIDARGANATADLATSAAALVAVAAFATALNTAGWEVAD